MSLFNDVVSKSKQEMLPQRLLFMFAKATPGQTVVPTKHKSGTIQPTMCVDKLPSELATFKELVSEADSYSRAWDFVFIAGLSGKHNLAPSSDDASPHLKKMCDDLLSGGDLSRYVILGRDEKLVVIS